MKQLVEDESQNFPNVLKDDPSDLQALTPGHFLTVSLILGILVLIIRCPIQKDGISLRYFVSISGTDGPNITCPVANSLKVDIIYTRSSGG
ncbi:hypothetical protein TNCV_2046161 [Trichonephila clavipes]|uniref:Uncharacterized protein n=1 Tax=Trichonephila clavipes TaxID=2585209 RepID=A0A8X6SVL6_TRICX|nr:hypothetical protein TNCV_2046161 [Trichonephila clavipes]